LDAAKIKCFNSTILKVIDTSCEIHKAILSDNMSSINFFYIAPVASAAYLSGTVHDPDDL
jgi:hypothetical protein